MKEREVTPEGPVSQEVERPRVDSRIEIAVAALRALEATAKHALGVEEEHGQLRLEYKEQSEKVWRLIHDDVAPSFLNRQGLMETIRSDQSLAEELKQGKTGLVFLDVRFLKHINDTLSSVHGDVFLAAAVEKITATLEQNVRLRTEAGEDERPEAEDGRSDIAARYGGDEFIILVRNVTEGQLALIAKRLKKQFSVKKAANEARDPLGIPIAADVVTAHAGRVDDQLRTDNDTSGREVFMAMMEQLQSEHMATKARQYEKMWHMIVKAQPRLGRMDRPSEDRVIAGLFLQICCSDFMDRAQSQLAFRSAGYE